MLVPDPPAAAAGQTEDRTARVRFVRPTGWRTEEPAGADLRVRGDDVVLTVRSRPSDRAIGDENASLLERLPGSVDGLLLVGCDVWTTAGAPARLVEYVRPDEEGDVAGAHLLLVTGRHRVDLTVERPLARMTATDDTVFAVLDSVRVLDRVTASESRTLESLPVLLAGSTLTGPSLGAEAVSTLQNLAGRRWNPALLRTDGGRELVAADLVGRFGTVPPETATVLAPWAEGVQPTTLDQHDDDGRVTRLQAWSGTVVDTGADGRSVVASVPPERVVGLLAGRLGIRPTWTWPFRTAVLPGDLLDRRLAGGPSAPDLPRAVASADPTLAAFWSAPWTVSALLRPGRPRPLVVVSAAGIGFARVGRTEGGTTAFTAEASANVHRTLVRALLG
ncbi:MULTISPECIES: hypothetical protein [unclassified Curtobacterium]|uniref:hypothetical protein n=1 Tax=unclassified Curtobacterium TaxID=257496 RepID=UPI000D8AC20F|nr:MULTISPECIES: hypothetical protein [unclassified Curtobacterium]PYY35767.1 hypothetical protein DEI89_05650 [Curtobacterium sp. MCBD17_030]PZE36551.1 hypothetical protein DEJ31_09285 [Curtobacterium sp. MCPF17_031]PZF10656.1 hypothetical protein DEJ25_12585 [Curtobacterium sp. MCPF17_011]